MSNQNKTLDKIQLTSHALVIFSICVIALYLGQSILIPLIFGGILWLLMRNIRFIFNKLPLSERWFPRWLKTTLSTILLFSILWIVGVIFEKNIQILVQHYPTYLNNFNAFNTSLKNETTIDLTALITEFDFQKYSTSFFSEAVQSIKSILSNTIVILIYMLFFISEESSFSLKIKALSKNSIDYTNNTQTITKIERAVSSYLGLKSLVALIVATISFVVFLVYGLQAPFFWSLLIFILSFIPFIGVLFSSFLSALFALAQFGSMGDALILLLIIGGIQFISGNIIEPKLMGNSMNVSPLVVVISLSFWGLIWGFPGMFLSVPITVILVIVFSKFETTKNIAILLSEKGDIDTQ